MRNTNATMSEALVRLDAIADHCARANKHLVVYLSMGFGNPYMDEWSEEMVLEWSSLDLMQKFSLLFCLLRTRWAWRLKI